MISGAAKLMKFSSAILTFLAFLAAAVAVYGETSSVGTHTKQIKETLYAADDINAVNFTTVTSVDFTGVTLRGDTVGDGTYGGLAEENTGLGSEYALGTVFSTVTTFQSVVSSSKIAASLTTNDLTVLADAAGKFLTSISMSVISTDGVDITFGIFLNNTTAITSIVRPIVGGHTHTPTFINLSAGVFNTLSSIDYLTHEDGDSIVIDEVQGNTPGFLIDFTFNGSVLAPHHTEFSVLYDGTPTDEVECRMWNYTLNQWDEARDGTNDVEDGGGSDAFRYLRREFEFPNHEDYVDTLNRESKTRIIHTSVGGPGHNISFDLVSLHDRHNAAAVALTNIITLREGDVVSVKMKSSKDDTTLWLQNMHLEMTRISQ